MRATAEGKWSGSEQEVHFMLSGKDRGSYSDSSRNNENRYNSDIESYNAVTVKVAVLRPWPTTRSIVGPNMLRPFTWYHNNGTCCV